MNIEKYDEIHIENLVCFARHGVYPEETALGQKFVVSLTMYTKRAVPECRTSWKHRRITER